MSLALCTATLWYGLVIRSYSSFKLLRKLDEVKQDELMEFLHFWTAFSIIALYESYLELFFSWVPLYSFFKLLLLWYIILPSTRGSTVIFENFIEPKFSEKVLWLERGLLINIVSTFAQTNQIWDQLTSEVANRLPDLNEVELAGMKEKLLELAKAIDGERSKRQHRIELNPQPATVAQPQVEKVTVALISDQRRTVSNVSSSSSEVEYEMVEERFRSQTASPVVAELVVETVTIGARDSPAKVESRVFSPSLTGMIKTPEPKPASAARVVQSGNSNFKAAGVPYPSFFPTRGIKMFLQSEEESEDIHDATLKSIERDESPRMSRSEKRTIPVPAISEKKAPPEFKTPDPQKKLTWLSSMWAFSASSSSSSSAAPVSAASSIARRTSSSDDSDYEGDGALQQSATLAGPTTRSRAKQQMMKERQPVVREQQPLNKRKKKL